MNSRLGLVTSTRRTVVDIALVTARAAMYSARTKLHS